MTRHEAMFKWIQTYPSVSKLFTYDFGKIEEDSSLFRFISEESVIKDITGEETVEYKFAIGEYRSYTNEPFTNENIENVEAVDEFISWVKDQDDIHNYPQIENATVEKVRAVRTGSGIGSVDPIMRKAQYTFTVIVTYIKGG